MYAIISEIDPQANLKLDKLRTECLSACNLEIPRLRWPFHLTWQSAESYRLPEIEKRVQMIARMFAPVELNVDGIGIFTGEDPVLYLTITRTPALTALNQTLWESLLPFAEGMNPLFSPDDWVPHVSFIYGEAKASKAISCVVEQLIPLQMGMTLKIEAISLVYDQEDKNGLAFQYPLTGLSNNSQETRKGESQP